MKIAVLGLGYVGLPLAVRLAKKYDVTGIDINHEKINCLKQGKDPNKELSEEELKTTKLTYTTDVTKLREQEIIIVTVPTPVDENNKPDITLVEKATKTVGQNLSKQTIVVFESTVYPGLTEEICVPILEQESGLKYNQDFYAGYSPERINPGDKKNTIEKVVKVVSGSTEETAQKLKNLYESIIPAGVYLAPSIKVAEASKIVENIQRDVNISLVNELAILFDKLGIDIYEVLKAAKTKWNFHPYTPGLVGGHCIGVDPYYLIHKAKSINYEPKIIIEARKINDEMPRFYAEKIIQELKKTGQNPQESTIGIFGLTFKANCSDYRNTKSKDLIKSLNAKKIYGIDPYLTPDTIRELGAEPASLDELPKIDIAVIVVPHKEFENLQLNVPTIKIQDNKLRELSIG